jgi:demethylmenaquinone methyltransferase/2-methoxy-6-polyprenyl-1,4-benzoquinol methylase
VGRAPTPRNRRARALFAPLAPTYDRGAALLSLGQGPRWRRFLVSRIDAGPGDTVLDVATGTAAVAVELARTHGCSVVGVDQSAEMLAAGRFRLQQAGLAGRVRLHEARAEELPFESASFAALTFTYLLRYVDDPAATLRELARVVAPGGTVAMLEFAVPSGAVPRAAWELYVRAGLPAAGALLGCEWYDVGRFLRGSIGEFYERTPLRELPHLFAQAGIAEPTARLLSAGGAVVVWGRRGD